MFVTGPYTATFKPQGGSATDIGATEDGFEVIETPHFDPIRTDGGGDSTINAIHRGGDTVVRLTASEWDLITLLSFNAYPTGNPIPNVGFLMSALAGELVLTPKAQTTAATAGKTWTFYLAYVESDIPALLAARQRRVPLTLRCLPDPAHTNKTHVAV